MLAHTLIICGLKNGKKIKKVCLLNNCFIEQFLYIFFLKFSEWFSCLWNNCTFQSNCEVKSTTHVNFHAYHTRLKCVGLAVMDQTKVPVCLYTSQL